MVLLIECIVCCLVFGGAIVSSVIVNKEFWLKEYSETVQQKYIGIISYQFGIV